MTWLRSFHYGLGVAILVTAMMPTLAGAQPYPNRPVRIVVGYPAGGPVDVTARFIVPGLQKSLGQPVVIDNRGGASGTVGADHVAKAAPDGHTLFFSASATRAINPHVQKNMPFDALKDYTPISLVVNASNALVVAQDNPARTVGELITYAKANPERVTFGSAGIGASNHLSGELLQKVTDTRMVHIPYKGNAPSMADVMGGKITFMFDAISTAASAAKGGRARVLAVASPTRSRALPDIPTMAEAGITNFDVPNFYGFEGPPGLPAPIVARLNAAMREALADPDIAKRLIDGGYDLAPGTPEDYAAKVKATYDHWARVTAGMKFE